jgi:hypothetical protein
MAVHGVDTSILVSGAGLALTDEATSLITGTTYQVTNATKRLLDPDAAITVKDGGVTIDPDDYTLDRLFGRVVLAGAPGGAVTVSGTYLPVAAVATATSFGISRKATNVETTPLGAPGAAVQRQQVLKDVSGSIGRFDEADDLFVDALIAGGAVCVQLNVSGSPHRRMWALVMTSDIDGEADGLLEEGIEWEGTTDADGRVYSAA